MSALTEVRAAQYEYEQRLREAGQYRQVQRLEKANGKRLAKRVAAIVAVLASVLGLR